MTTTATTQRDARLTSLANQQCNQAFCQSDTDATAAASAAAAAVSTQRLRRAAVANQNRRTAVAGARLHGRMRTVTAPGSRRPGLVRTPDSASGLSPRAIDEQTRPPNGQS